MSTVGTPNGKHQEPVFSGEIQVARDEAIRRAEAQKIPVHPADIQTLATKVQTILRQVVTGLDPRSAQRTIFLSISRVRRRLVGSDAAIVFAPFEAIAQSLILAQVTPASPAPAVETPPPVIVDIPPVPIIDTPSHAPVPEVAPVTENAEATLDVPPIISVPTVLMSPEGEVVAETVIRTNDLSLQNLPVIIDVGPSPPATLTHDVSAEFPMTTLADPISTADTPIVDAIITEESVVPVSEDDEDAISTDEVVRSGPVTFVASNPNVVSQFLRKKWKQDVNPYEPPPPEDTLQSFETIFASSNPRPVGRSILARAIWKLFTFMKDEAKQATKYEDMAMDVSPMSAAKESIERHGTLASRIARGFPDAQAEVNTLVEGSPLQMTPWEFAQLMANIRIAIERNMRAHPPFLILKRLPNGKIADHTSNLTEEMILTVTQQLAGITRDILVESKNGQIVQNLIPELDKHIAEHAKREKSTAKVTVAPQKLRYIEHLRDQIRRHAGGRRKR
jgi:hypothetical protein